MVTRIHQDTRIFSSVDRVLDAMHQAGRLVHYYFNYSAASQAFV